VLRLLPDETLLLNSKEKAPFLLLVEARGVLGDAMLSLTLGFRC